MHQTPEQIEKKLNQYFKSGKNVLLEGKHGTGKTSLIQKVFGENCKNWLYFSGATLDPWVDFIGVPKEVEKNGEHVLSFVLPEKMSDPNVEAIFIDEYNRSHKKVRNGAMELIQFKSINGRKFPNLKVVWAAVNPSDDEDESYDVETLDPAQLDRFQVKIQVPYVPDFEYFKNKFGVKIAQSAIEWWDGLPKDGQKLVSPRRLDYALEVFQEGGDIYDVLDEKSNPTKLLVTLQVGSLLLKVKEFYETKNGREAKKFFLSENNYQGALPIIKKNKEYLQFFLPLLNNERLAAIFFSDTKVQKFVLENSQLFKDPLEEISRLKAVDPVILAQINNALKKVGNVTFF
jgi:ATPase family associated with various cellular activities (AAA)